MRSFGRLPLSSPASARTPLLCLVAAGFAFVATASHAQTAPQIIPYTMSTYAGPNAAPGTGTRCGSYIALDPQGDGCLASAVSVGSDPHDVRVDAQGFVYWIDNASSSLSLLHKINPYTKEVTVELGSGVVLKGCNNATSSYGCPANDGAANNTTGYTYINKNYRGMAIGANGDIYLAGYSSNDNYVHKISSSTGIFSIPVGSASGTSYSGSLTTVGLGVSRGIGVDAYGNVYIAETANNIVTVACFAVAPNSPCGSAQVGQVVQLTATNTSSTKVPGAGVAAINQQLLAPEDVQIDSNGNIYIADQGNNLVRAIWEGKGSLPGIANPVMGFIYNIAGNGAATLPAPNGTYQNSPYPSSFTPVTSATSVALAVRKISLDAQNNLYISDSSENVIWFVDNATGSIRIIAGQLGPASGAAAPGCAAASPAGNTVGDGCPGSRASLYLTGSSADGANAADNQGNLYITDGEGGAANARIRKLLSGLNFPSVAVGNTATQTLFIHFGAGDSYATAASSNPDFNIGAKTCNTNAADTTSDCLLPVTFKPAVAGKDNATLTLTSSKGLVSVFLLTGTGSAPQFVIDPGNITVSSTVTTNPQGIFVDGSNNAYIADTGNNRVLYIPSGGVATVLAGSPTGLSGFSGDNGPASAATFNGPSAITVDSAHNVYIADTGNNRIRKINAATGVITTYAGGASSVCAAATNAIGDFCPAIQATLASPSGLAADNLGNIYIADTLDNRIRLVSLSGILTTFAGGGTGTCTNPSSTTDTQGDGCPASAAILSGPTGLAFDPVGNFLVLADTGISRVRKIFLGTYIPQSTTYLPAAVQINPISLVAGTGAAGSAPATLATSAQLNKPAGVYVDAAENVYIADTQNSAIRMVDFATGDIFTVAGIIGTSGIDVTLPNSATDAQLNLPASVSIAAGVLTIADSANNRILNVARSAINYNFGRVNVPTTGSPVVTFNQTSTGNTVAALSTPAYVATGDTTQFLFSIPGNSTGCAANASYAPGTFCQYTGQFIPTSAQPTPYSATYTETGATALATPSINLIGTGAVLTPTNPVVSQTSPTPPTQPQYGQPVSLSVTVNATCNPAAPSCYPTGSVRFSINGTLGSPVNIPAGSNSVTLSNVNSLQLGNNTISCSYSGDFYYAAGSCPAITIVVVQASTTSRLTATGSGQVQYPTTNCFTHATSKTDPYSGDTECDDGTLTATVTSSTVGIPNGTVTFSYAPASGGTPIAFNGGTNVAINNATGQAQLVLMEIVNPNGYEVFNNTLPAGSFTLTCAYMGPATNSNYASSNCPGIPFTVLADTPGIASIITRGCSITTLSVQNTVTPTQNGSCTTGAGSSEQKYNGVPEISTADGASTDASIFISPTNTLTGTLTFSCSGLPQYTACTFSPTSIALSPGSGHIAPVYTDVTVFTDVQPGNVGAINKPAFGHANIITLAQLGITSLWPFTALPLLTLYLLRRRLKSLRIITLLGLALLLSTGALGLNGCAGPGAYKATLTPASPGGVPYLITVNITNGTATATTNFYLNITAPGITGQQ